VSRPPHDGHERHDAHSDRQPIEIGQIDVCRLLRAPLVFLSDVLHQLRRRQMRLRSFHRLKVFLDEQIVSIRRPSWCCRWRTTFAVVVVVAAAVAVAVVHQLEVSETFAAAIELDVDRFGMAMNPVE
jgi:hypothetical protein